MKNEERKKKFDTVKMMREIRDRLSHKYLGNLDLERKDLEKIRDKYGIKEREDTQTLFADWLIPYR